MLPGLYLLQHKSKILMFEATFVIGVVDDLCGQGHTERLQQQQQQRSLPDHCFIIGKLRFMLKMCMALRRDASAAVDPVQQQYSLRIISIQQPR